MATSRPSPSRSTCAASARATNDSSTLRATSSTRIGSRSTLSRASSARARASSCSTSRLARSSLCTMLFELAPPDRRVVARQAVGGKGADAGQRRAQVVGDVARELALGLDAAIDAREQRVDGGVQPLDVARSGIAGDRPEIARMAQFECALQVAERRQLAADLAPQVEPEQQQQETCGSSESSSRSTQETISAQRRLADDDDERPRALAAQGRHAERFAGETRIRERAGPQRGGAGGAEIGVAGDDRPAGLGDREVLLVFAVEEHVVDIARRQAEDEPAIALDDVGGDHVGVVEQGAVEGPAGQHPRERERHCAADRPGRCQRQQHAQHEARAQRAASRRTGRPISHARRNPPRSGSRARAGCGWSSRCRPASCAGAR